MQSDAQLMEKLTEHRLKITNTIINNRLKLSKKGGNKYDSSSEDDSEDFNNHKSRSKEQVVDLRDLVKNHIKLNMNDD